MKFTWTMPAECDINIFQIVTRVNVTIITEMVENGFVSDAFVNKCVESEIEFAIDGEGYTLDEVPIPIFEQIKKKVLENVGYQMRMDLGEEW